MPRSIWRGVLSFGMVAIPVRLYLATESSSKVSFHLLCPEHKSRIKNKRWCVDGDHEVAWSDVERAYEYEKGSYVELTDEDLEKLPLRSSKAIDISGFVEKSDIAEELYIQSAYYIEPEKVEKREVIEAPEPEAETTVVDLMAALKASVERAKKAEQAGGRAKRGGHESLVHKKTTATKERRKKAS